MDDLPKTQVLLVDDEPIIREWVVRSLDDYDVSTDETAEDALATMAANGPPTFLVCDNSLPGMSGIELARLVQQAYPDVVRILITGAAFSADVREAQAEGLFEAVLDKPTGTIKLRDKLIEIMSKSSGA